MHRVLMVGPALHLQGGISTVQQLLLDNWKYDEFEVQHISTHKGATRLSQLTDVPLSILKFAWKLLAWRPHIVHIHFSWKSSFYRKSIFAIIPKLFGIKVVMHCHSSRFDLFYEGANRIVKCFIRNVLNSVDAIAVVSNRWAGFFGYLNLRTPVYVVQNAVEIPARRFEHKSDTSKRVILTLGRLGRRKGTYDLLDAVPRVLERHESIEFWLGGDGDVERIREVISGRPWAKHVKLLGWVNGNEKKQIMSHAYMFVLPSYNEGLPMALLEAMAYSIPVISTNVGGIPDLLTNGDNGFVFSPGDIPEMVRLINSLLDNPSLAEDLGRRGFETVVRNHEIRLTMQRLYDLYRSIL